MRIPPEPQRSGYVDEQINEAIARGEFKNLNGQGKPLNLKGDLSERKVMREKLRHDAGFAPPWDDVGREIEQATARLETAIRVALEFRRAGMESPKTDKLKVEADFQGQLQRLEEQVAAINSLVLKHNLLLPRELPRLYRKRIALADTLDRLRTHDS